MTIAERLFAIANMHGDDQSLEVATFAGSIALHPEEKTLMDCLTDACVGRTETDFGRNPFVPESLKDEGFWIRAVGSGFHLCFGPKPENSTTAQVTA